MAHRSGPEVTLAAAVGLTLAILAAAPLGAQTYVGAMTRPGLDIRDIAVYETGNKVYVADGTTNTIFVYQGTSLAPLGSIPVAGRVYRMLVHEPSGKMYVSIFGDGTHNLIAVVDLVNDTLIHNLTGTYTNFPSLRQDAALGKVYVLCLEGLTQIDVATDAETLIPGFGGGGYEAVDVNPVTHEVFVVRYIQNVLVVVDGVTLGQTAVPGLGALGVTVNWLENKAYTAYPLRVYDRAAGTSAPLSCDNDATEIFFSPDRNRLFTDCEVDAVSSLVGGEDDTCFNLPMIGGVPSVVIRGATGHVYYRGWGMLFMLDESSQLLEGIALPGTDALAVSQGTGRVFVAGVVDGGTDAQVTVFQDEPMPTRPPLYLGTVCYGQEGFPPEMLVYDPVTMSVTGTLEFLAGGYAFQAEHTAVCRPGGGRLYVPFTGHFGTSVGVMAGVGSWSELAAVSTGGQGLAAAAVTPDGSRVYVTNHGSNSVGVVDAATNTPLTTVPVGNGPWGIAMAPDGARLWVANRGVGTVSVVSTASNTVTGTIPVGSEPFGLAVNPTGSRLYVANSGSGTVSVVDTALSSVVATITVGSSPHWVALSPDGTTVWVTNSGSGTVSVIAAATNVVSATVPVGAAPEGVAPLPDGSRVFVVCSSPGGGSSLSAVRTSDLAVTTVSLPPAQPPGTHLLGYSATVPDPTARFAGRVVVAGTPIAGATVRAIQAGSEKGTGTSSGSGEYCVANLAPGTYDLVAEAAGYPAKTRSAQAGTAGRVTAVTFDLWSEIPGGTRGDANNDGTVNVTDVFYVINYLFAGGPPPASTCRADTGNDGSVSVADVFFLINYLFAGGPAPSPPAC